MENQELQVHELDTIEHNLSVEELDEEGARDAFMVASASGFMVASASGFMVASASGFMVASASGLV